MALMLPPLSLSPIGVIHTPFPDKVSTPRQPYAANGAPGTLELFPGRNYEPALCDLESWDHIWVLFWFHLVENWRAKVLPPRSGKKRRGVFSTRSPHRPNPIGMSVLRLEAVEGLVLKVRDVDMIDGTPVLDIKPYVPYIDAFPDASTGWLAPLSEAPGEASRPGDPEPGFAVLWSEAAAVQARWLRARGVELMEPVERTLKLGPQPHPYRRIRPEGDALLLAVKEWRVRFHVEGRQITVERLRTGYREEQLAVEAGLELHRAFTAEFGR
jgi:tRNA (adenine37-N6)-methyltransferase